MDKVKLFKKGYKPALFCSDSSDWYNELKHDYKYVEFDRGWFHSFRLFFTNEAKYEDFICSLGINKGDVLEYKKYEREIGLALGFPPVAVDYYCNEKKYTDQKDEVNVDYYGITFNCHKNDVVECIDWMKDNYKIPNLFSEDISIIVPDNIDYMKQHVLSFKQYLKNFTRN